jgi:hypothetical protein
MDGAAAEQLLDDLLYAMETLETRCAGILQFLKAEEYATDEQLAPFMEQAANASNVRWRAARLRMTSLLHSAMQDMETSGRKVEPSVQQAEPAGEEARASGSSKDEVSAEPAQEAATKDSSLEAGVGRKTDSAQPNAPTKGEISTRNNPPKGSGVEQTAAAQPQTLQSKDKPAETTGDVTPEQESAQPPNVEQKSGKAEKQPEAPEKPGKQNAA